MGLSDLQFTTPRMASFEFSDWLNGEEFRTLVEEYRLRGQEPTCLLDIITLWVTKTDALLRFPTFSSFLLTVLEIVNEWQRDIQVYADAILWPLPPGSDEDGLFIASLAGPWEGREYNRDVASHDIMREENFLLRQTELRYERDSIHP